MSAFFHVPVRWRLTALALMATLLPGARDLQAMPDPQPDGRPLLQTRPASLAAPFPMAWEQEETLSPAVQPPAEAPVAAPSSAPSRSADANWAEHAWREMLESYFHSQDPEATLVFLQSQSPGPFSADQVRILVQTAAFLDRDRLSRLVNQQPQESRIAPYLQLVLGDKQAALGEEETAHQLWRQVAGASQAPAAAAEALLRLGQGGRESPVPFKVGLLLPLSGPSAQLGQNLLHAAQQALAHYRDVPLSLEVADTRGEMTATWAAMDRLAEQGVRLVLGPVFHAPAKAAAEEARKRGLPLITFNPQSDVTQTRPGGGLDSGPVNPPSLEQGGVYLNAFHPTHQALVMARHAILNRKLRQVAILAPKSRYGEHISGAFAQETLRLGGRVTRLDYFSEESPDFSMAIRSLAHLDEESQRRRSGAAKRAPRLDPADPLGVDKATDLEPWVDFEALFLPARADQVRLIAPQAVFYNAGPPHVTLLGSALWNNTKLLLMDGTDYLQGAVFCDTASQPREQFDAAYQKNWSEPASQLAQLAYDGVAVVAQMLRDERLGGPSWQVSLQRPEGFPGSTGRVRFLPNGESLRDYHLYHVTGNGVAYLAGPPPMTAGGDVFPKRPEPSPFR
ncbi:MAG: penicillin-binding protein activator [Magnetococcales bacterium]|nr:penicillin-binding protein activator [Magnetococcales bacterium]